MEGLESKRLEAFSLSLESSLNLKGQLIRTAPPHGSRNRSVGANPQAMMIKNKKDFWAGIFFIAFGAGAAVVAQENALGTLSRMGPGFFPTALGVILALLGCGLSLRALLLSGTGDGSLEKVHWGILLCILGSVAVFAVTLLEFGVLLSIALMIVLSSLASGRFRAGEVGVLTVFMCLLCWLIFIVGVGLQVPVLPAFI